MRGELNMPLPEQETRYTYKQYLEWSEEGTGYVGTPDLIVEIVSPSTARSDKFYKFNMYEKFGVKEYWIIEPDIKLISVFTLSDNGRYGRPEIYSEIDKVNVKVLKDLEIDLSDVFDY